MRKVDFGGILMALIFLAGCGASEDGSPGPYFDTKAYFAAEIERLKSGNFEFRKSTSLQDITMRDSVYKPDWENEFSLLSKYDLDNPANYGRFKVDTQFKTKNQDLTPDLAEHNFKVTYIDLDIKSGSGSLTYEVDWERGEVVALAIQDDKENMLYESTKLIRYRADGFSVSGGQKIRGGNDALYAIEANYLPRD